MRFYKILPAITAVFLGGLVSPGNAMSETLDVTTTQVVIFKDGYCLFVKEAQGRTDEAGRAVVREIPEAMVLGSFWALPKTGKLTSIISRQERVRKQGREEIQKNLVLQFDPEMAGKEVELNLIYFTPGIRWIPTYRIALGENGRAHLSMQAEILNEAEDLHDVPLDLVVGVPNFRFKGVISPLSLEASLRNVLQQVAPQLMGQDVANTFATQRMGERRGELAGQEVSPGTGVPALPPELAAEGAQDLFVYHVPELTLRAGERAAVPLISTQVPYRHLYAWEVRLSHSGAEAVPGKGAHTSPLRLLKNEVWHLIELTNTTNLPWTTGAALMMDGFLPVAQELLTYTSIGAKCQIPLTIAVDVRGTYSEEEVGRELKALRFDGSDYVRISKKGTLHVTNYKKEPISLILTCEFGGNATEASDGGKITVSDFQAKDWTDFRGHRALTGHSTIQWELGIDPGESKQVTCEYFYYTR